MSNSLPLAVRNALLESDWRDDELAVYSSLLERGPQGLTQLSQETCLPIATVQRTVKRLIVRKLIEKTVWNEKPVYAVSDPRSLIRLMKAYVKISQSRMDTVERFVDQYDFDPKRIAPRVRFFEGIRGVKRSYHTMLAECEVDEMVAFFSVVENVGEELQRFFEAEYVPKRVARGIRMRNLALECPTGIAYSMADEAALRETRLVSREFFPSLNTEINLYGDFLHCMSFDAKGAFAFILQDAAIVALLKAVFEMVWKQQGERLLYMTDDPASLQETMNRRKSLYTENFSERYKSAKPRVTDHSGERVLTLLGHEVMSSAETPYMHALADIVTQGGGDILNVGYGLGIIDVEIERLRRERNVGRHCVIELHPVIAAQARKIKNLEVWEGDWKTVLERLHGLQFQGIVYDAYPLSLSAIHRDGIEFIEYVSLRNLLKEDGTLTFYVDAAERLGKRFVAFLGDLGFELVSTRKVTIKRPKREWQTWDFDHFLAPTVRYVRSR